MGFFNRIFPQKKLSDDFQCVPKHIAIIPDGNGRWAKKRGLPRNVGHREGSMTLKKVVIYCSNIGVKHLTIYAFSTENWKRPQSEVDALMNLLLEFLRNAERELEGSNVRIKVIGDINGLPGELQNEIARVEKFTGVNNGLNLNIALNYGSRFEILNAVRNIAQEIKNGKLSINDIDEKQLEQHLYTKGIPEPDLLIRTSGEQRISNYLLWQCAYTEFWFTDTLWPDINDRHIADAIKAFEKRNRRYGGVEN
ncbi:isoprenyl transferase [Ruminiclostridium cellulolyticum]|uniref:Isoprenyl transferase n=1 Tax=Ruminiclostridium cellulolyticum (strain ATCC 35319 / DSM 5812 / JCM 6584 / H10) TaxID=394503 RepID=B8I6D7_RUMCH|nr:isoprenyl transferase [Ruminiclostridium cellulolyticum]ACL74829.1 undecaprenyl diphosphate synthase [Ruminiclostridium cellulolyticum H10]